MKNFILVAFVLNTILLFSQTCQIQATANPICQGSSTTLSLTHNIPNPTSFLWSNNSETSPSITISPSSTATITCTISDGSSSCTTPGFVINVNPIPNVNTNAPQTICNNNLSTAINFSGSVSGTTYAWTNSNINIGLGALGNGNIGAFNATNTTNSPITGTITVTPTANSCPGSTKTILITVNPTPNVNDNSPQTICNNVSSTAINFSGLVSGTTYSWTNSNTNIGIAASGNGNIAAFNATNTSSSPISSTITATPTANSCAGSTKTILITVNPTPNVNDNSPQTICNNNSSTAINFSGLVSGTTYAWTNSNINIGLGASGNGNIGAFNAINTSSSPISSTITVTPTANSCAGSTKTILITVNPTPNVNTNAPQTICNNNSSTAINFSGLVSGTTYTWTNSNTNIGLGASGNGNIGAFNATNTSSSPSSSTITVTPTANFCSGSNKTILITVNPTPNVIDNSPQTICNNNSSAAINFSGLVSGTTYSWTNSNINIGLGASGNGSIGAFNATNTSISPISSTITVTPTANSCTGPTKTILITVNPTPNVNTNAPQTICNNNSSTANNFSGLVSGTTYAWTNSNINIGLGASGNGNIGAFNATNTSNSPITSTITVTPTANSCSGSTKTILITVNPTPDITTVLNNQNYCNGQLTNVVSFLSNVSNTTFNWTNSNNSIGLNSSGSGTINSFTATNSTSSDIFANIAITPTANGCLGQVQSFVFTVKPTPIVNAGSNQVINCTQNVTGVTIGMSPVFGVSYSWSPIGGLFSTNSSSTIAIPSSTTSYILTAYNPLNGCQITDTVIVTVNTNNPISNAGQDANITCSINSNGATIGTLSSGFNYSWSPSLGLQSTNTSQTLANPPTTTTYTLTVTNPTNGCVSNDQVIINVNNTPPISFAGANGLIDCSQNTTGVLIGMQPSPGITYSWSPNSGLSSSNSSLVLANPLNTTSYILTATNPTNGCITTDNVLVTVDKTLPSVNAGQDITFCSNGTIELNGTSNGNTTVWSPSSLVNNPNELVSIATPIGQTIFTLTATGLNGCIASDGITASPSPSIQSGLNSEYTLCANELLNLSTSSNLTCNWSGLYSSNQNSIEFQVSQSGILSLELSNADGCIASEEINVIVNPIPFPIISGNQYVCQNSYWVNYAIPATPNFIQWTIINGEPMSPDNMNNVAVHWANGSGGLVQVTETIAETGCSNNYELSVVFDPNLAPDTTEVLELTDNVLYTPQDFVFMSWGYESISNPTPISVGVYSQYCNFTNFDPSQFYYWVEVGNGNGCTTKSYYNGPNFIAAIDNQVFENFIVYPIPSSDQLLTKGIQSKSPFSMIDLNGKVLIEGFIHDNSSIDVSTLSSGIYILNMFIEGKYVQRKVIKE